MPCSQHFSYDFHAKAMQLISFFSVSQVHSQNYHLVCADTAVHIPDLFSTAEVLVHILLLVGGHTQLKARFTQLLENLKTIELPGGVELSI